jgi:putative hydrolase
MSDDNLFDKLGELFRSNGPVNWRLGREIAESVAGQHDPVEPWLAEEYRELAVTAGQRIAAVSPLDPTSHTNDVRPTDRRSWAANNVEAFSYLAEPVAEKMATGGPPGSPLAPLGPALFGMQMGSVVGFMSQRVLGLFDVGIATGDDSPISFIVPNVEALASEHDLDPRQTRLWVALHEVTHLGEFLVPWVREHYLMLMHQFVEELEVDPEEIARRMESLQDPDALQKMLDDPSGLTGLLAGDAQQGPLDDIRAFMAVMEGYGEYLIERAAPGLIPQADRIRRTVDARRMDPAQDHQILNQVLGLDLQHHQYGLGAAFCEEVDERWGDETLARLWEGPAMLPTMSELTDVVGWAARVLLDTNF